MYNNKQASHAIVRASNAHDTAENLAATAAVYGEYYVCRPIKVTGFYFAVTTALACDNAAAVIELNRRPTLGSSSGEVAIATITFADATAAGKVVYKHIEPVLVYPGDGLSLEHVTQATDSGTAAGIGFYGFDYEVVGEALVNCTDWVASS